MQLYNNNEISEKYKHLDLLMFNLEKVFNLKKEQIFFKKNIKLTNIDIICHFIKLFKDNSNITLNFMAEYLNEFCKNKFTHSMILYFYNKHTDLCLFDKKYNENYLIYKSEFESIKNNVNVLKKKQLFNYIRSALYHLSTNDLRKIYKIIQN